ncbi:E3 ubiquitin-protein ligase RFWD3-like [Oppia nitens]|uniref:E3 ubiquitin-protein ligase RFWD3-like n=1 Tax=Oppia nitens TaxID=1686743 RepID=UPI0023DB49F4|nr:E3 ubiquitin-protein ligase RFWD3-like [Oppia nitens]
MDFYDYEDSSDSQDEYQLYDNSDSNSDNDVNESIEIIEDMDSEDNRQMTDQHIDDHTYASNHVNNEQEMQPNSDQMIDKSETKSSINLSILCTQENGDNNCIICTELWTNCGEHQLVSLCCGHLFGRKCIEQWLDPKNKQNQRCPQCNLKAKKKDIRVLYARNLRPLDTSERDNALEMLRKERLLRQKLETEAIESTVKLKSVLEENERLKKEFMDYQKRSNSGSKSRILESINRSKSMVDFNKNADRFQYLKNIEINTCGECKHLGYSALFEIIAVSQPNPNNQLFPGFGIKKIFLNDFKSDNICIHSKPIKDLEINAYDGTILTTSLDKTVKLTSLLNKMSILSYTLESDAWSITFNPKKKDEFYAGLNNGQILLFDTRMMSSYVDKLVSPDRSPVVSLNHMDFQTLDGPINGILSTQFNNFSLYKRFDGSLNAVNFTPIKIPIEGRFGSSHVESKSGLVLLSCRPSSRHINTTHFAMELKASIDADNEYIIEPEIINRFEGGKQQVKLTRSRIFAHPYNENSALICAGDESAQGALIWDLGSTKCLQKLKCESTVLDMSLLHNSNTNSYFMSALTESSIKFYKFIQ